MLQQFAHSASVALILCSGKCRSFSKNESVQRTAIETFQELKLNKPGSQGESATVTCCYELVNRIAFFIEEKQFRDFASVGKEEMVNDEVIGMLWRFVMNSSSHEEKATRMLRMLMAQWRLSNDEYI